MGKNLCKVLGFVSAVIGIWFIAWEITNGQLDEYFAYGLIACVIAALLLFQGFRKDESAGPERPRCVNHNHLESVGYCEVCGKPFCEECLSEVYGRYCCHSCKEPFLQKISQIPLKSRTVALLLCLFLGMFGIHRIYLGDNSGIVFLILHIIILPILLLQFILIIPIILYALILLILAVIVISDLFRIASGSRKDCYGRDLI